MIHDTIPARQTESAAAQEHRPAEGSAPADDTVRPAPAADQHDDKPDHVVAEQTVDGDLDVFGRPLRAGS